MDINYLLLLQNLRESTGNIFSPFLLWLSDLAVGFWPVAMVCMIYWAFDRKGGRKLLFGYSLGILMNGFLKLTFCVYRPWIRDSRVLPFGDSKVKATGYSFPSGHSTKATSLFGGMSVWLRNRKRWLSVVMAVVVALVLFSRNYLGVHTPQDVIVGFAATALMMFLAVRIEEWSDKDISRDRTVIIVGFLVCVAALVYYKLKPYPLTYLKDGSLLVDPAKMLADSFEGLGSVSALVVCRYFERRKFNFDQTLSWKDRFIIGVFALIPLYLWLEVCIPFILDINRSFGRFTGEAGIIVYAMIIVPWIMSKIHLPEKA